MLDAALLRALVDQTADPGTGYNVLPVPGYPAYRVGHGLEGSVVLLTPPESQPEPPTSLKRISLAPRIRCLVETGIHVDEIEAGVVEFRDDEPELVDHFLAVSVALIELLGDVPAPGDVARAMQRLLRLFASPDKGRGSELGVWGELLVINTSANPMALVDAWHASVDDKFDFAAAAARLEVKTTTRADRVHHFGLGQLLPVPGCDQHVVSLMTAETDMGSSVADLVAEVRAQLTATPDRQMKLLEQVSTILGTDWPRTARHRFDADGARAALRVLRAVDVPRVDPGPPAVVDVTLTVDVSGVKAVDAVDLAGAGPLASLIVVP